MSDDDKTLALLDEAVAHHQRGELARAEELYRQVLDRAGEDADALHLLGMICLQSQRPADAAVLEPKNLQTRLHLGIALRTVGDQDGALEELREALAIDPNFPEAHYNIGVILQDQGETAQASVHYQRTIELVPDFAQSYNNL